MLWVSDLVIAVRHALQCRILVCGPSNMSVDNLASRIITTYPHLKPKTRRLVAAGRQSLKSNVPGVESISVHNLAPGRSRKASRGIINAASIVCTTLVVAMDSLLEDVTFDCVLVDEATMSTEPECLIPVSRATKHVVLVGDQCQLGPIVLSSAAAKAGLNISMFERLVSRSEPRQCYHSLTSRTRVLFQVRGGAPFTMLHTQYRMHPAICEFPNTEFYRGQLLDGVTPGER